MKQRGITLIALVITIIVLLILAGVTINLTLGEEGIIRRAQQAVGNYTNASQREQAELNNFENVVENVLDTKPVQHLKAADLAKAPNKYWGQEVQGYECESNGVDTWKVFYADDNNVYLIASTYILYTDAPAGRNGKYVSKGYTEDCVYIYNSDLMEGYTGSKDITDEKIKALNKEYFDYLRANDTESTYSNKKSNIKQVAYLLDTQVWGVYKSDIAEYAIGGPTIELLLKSCNTKNSTNYMMKVDNVEGYSLSLDGGASWIATSGAFDYVYGTFDGDDLYFAKTRFYDRDPYDTADSMLCASPMCRI